MYIMMRAKFRLYFDTLKKTLLDAIEHGIMLNDGKVLGLSQKLLVRVNTRSEHLSSLWTHLAHLLGHLVRSYRLLVTGCRTADGHEADGDQTHHCRCRAES